METTYLKNGNLYEVRLTVFLAYVEYVGNGNYPFCCNIFTVDDKHFRCAVKPGDVAELFLLQRGDNLVLQLVPVVEASLVMGLASFRNLSQKRINLGEQKTPLHAWEFFSTALTVQEVCVLPMPYAPYRRCHNDARCILLRYQGFAERFYRLFGNVTLSLRNSEFALR